MKGTYYTDMLHDSGTFQDPSKIFLQAEVLRTVFPRAEAPDLLAAPKAAYLLRSPAKAP
jgi:hypothetical protein